MHIKWKLKQFSIVFEQHIDSSNSELVQAVADQDAGDISFSVGHFQLNKDCLDTFFRFILLHRPTNEPT